MDQLPVYLTLAFAPGLFWLWFFARRNIYRPDPKRILAATFFLGMASTIPAGVLNTVFVDSEAVFDGSASLTSVAAGMFFLVGPVEEACKFLAVRLYAYRTKYFDEPMDGLVYAAAASLGFASLENLQYVIEFGPEVMIGRAPLSTLGHVVFGSAWGYALGMQARAGKERSTFVLAAGILAAAILHGAFNTLLFLGNFAYVLLFFGAGVWWTLARFSRARKSSPFRYMRNYPNFACASCGRIVSVAHNHCRHCGVPVPSKADKLYCANCGRGARADARFCTGCGDQFLRRKG